VSIAIRPLREDDLPAADRIMRLAFGTFVGMPDPLAFMGDADDVRTRWQADPSAAFAAEADDGLAGSTFVTSWGSVGFFGPLTVRPDLWDQGIGQLLLDPTMATFETWGTRHAGLFTFAHSPKHLALYAKLGFAPRFLTSIMSRAVDSTASIPPWSSYAERPSGEKRACLDACRELTDAIYSGLDVRREIEAVDKQGLGDTILLHNGSQLDGFAVCHTGVGTEAGSDVCYVKFGAARPGPAAAERFARLIDACASFAARWSLARLVMGMNTGRYEAYHYLLARGFRADFVGVAMHRDNEPGYNRPEVYVVDDWR
jgi:predicted N-acetyltransferase YhbS